MRAWTSAIRRSLGSTRPASSCSFTPRSRSPAWVVMSTPSAISRYRRSSVFPSFEQHRADEQNHRGLVGLERPIPGSVLDDDTGAILVAGEHVLDRWGRRPAGDPDRESPHEIEVADVRQGVADVGHLPIEHRRHLVPEEAEVAGLGVAVHERDATTGLGALPVQLGK